MPATARLYRLITHRQVGPITLAPIGATGIHIRLRAGHDVEPPRNSLYSRVRVGGAVQIIGTTQPAVAHTRVKVEDVSTISHRTRAIATVITHSNGSFVTTWRPQQTGNYTIASAIAHPPNGLLPDTSCDLALTVVGESASRTGS